MRLNRRAAFKLAGSAAFALAGGLKPAFAAESESLLVNGHPESAEAGMKILREGGNAVDAIVGAALVAAVTSPHNCGIGGYGGHMTIYAARSKRILSIDFNTTAPAAAAPDMFKVDAAGRVADRVNELGWLAAGVPGTLAGLQLALDRYGTKPFREVVAPAIRFAADGFVVSEGLAGAIRAKINVLRKDPTSSALFLKNGEPLQAGELCRNPDEARLLQKLADQNSVEPFYRGEIARQIAAEFQKHHGLVTVRDLASYQAREVEPLRFDWNGWTVHTAPLTAGGLSVLQALSILKATGWDRMPESTERSHVMVEALRLAWADRLALLGDPQKTKVPVERLLAAESAEKLAGEARTAAQEKRPLQLRATQRRQSGTIHLNSVDARGNAVALTLTHGDSFGACVTVEGLGLTLGHGLSRFEPNPGHPNSPGPGKRPLHNMCPSILSRDGQWRIVLGGRGGRNIPNALYHVLANLMGTHKSLEASVAAPRFSTQGTLDLTVERRWPEGQSTALERMGFALKTGSVANVQAIALDLKSHLAMAAAR